jgi:hypothetical protein
MPKASEQMNSSKRVLEPYDRISEILFGLIMVLTITSSFSVADAGRDDVRTMLIGALGCNLAWGIIDALPYLIGCLSVQARGIHAWHAFQKATVTVKQLKGSLSQKNCADPSTFERAQCMRAISNCYMSPA